MNDTWIAFIAGAGWLAAFTIGLFALADWVQGRDRKWAGRAGTSGMLAIPVNDGERAALANLADSRHISIDDVARDALQAGIEVLHDQWPPSSEALASKPGTLGNEPTGPANRRRD